MALLMTMEKQSDDQLLVLAAKAAGYKVNYMWQCSKSYLSIKGDKEWNPLTDDGDALRLAVKLEIKLLYFTGGVSANRSIHGFIADERSGDIMADARRAITRVAAEIGRRMQDEQSTSAAG